MSLAPTSPYDTLTGQATASQFFATEVLGPPAVGWTLQMIGFGALVTYSFSYLSSGAFARDKFGLRLLLSSVLLLCVAQTGITFFLLFHYLTHQDRSAETLYSQTIGDALSTLPVGLQGALVQAFLARRASGLFEARWAKAAFLTFIGAGVLTGVFGSISYTVLSFYYRAGRLNDALPLTFQNVTGAWLWACAVVDITISICLGTQLAKKLGSVSELTNSILMRLISVAVESASYTAVTALMGAVLSFSFPAPSLTGQAALAFWGPLSSCYAFALLHTLSTRATLQELHAKGSQHGVRSPRGHGGAVSGVSLSFMRTTHVEEGEGEEIKFPPSRFGRTDRPFADKEGPSSAPMAW